MDQVSTLREYRHARDDRRARPDRGPMHPLQREDRDARRGGRSDLQNSREGHVDLFSGTFDRLRCHPLLRYPQRLREIHKPSV